MARSLKWTDITMRLCGLAEAAALLEMSESRVKDYCSDSTLRAVKVGRAWIIDRESVNQLSAERQAAM